MNKLTIIIIFLIFISCSNKKKFEKPIRISPSIVEFEKNRISKITLKTYYFHGKDSSELNLQKITEYYSENQIATESHLLTSSETQKGWKSFYDYKDSLLVQKRTINKEKDSTKVLYFYNSKNQLVKREHFSFKKRLLPEFIEKSMNMRNCIITEKDYEKNRTWDKVSGIKFTYDSIGQKTEYYAPDLHWDNQNKYKWFYDKVGDLIKKESWNNEELIWSENYSYKNNEYSYNRIWNEKEYQKDLKFIVFKNGKGEKIKELTLRNENIQNKRTFEYYDNGMLKKKIVFDENNEPLITYIFKKE
jgi:hypothetical protein